MPEIEIKDKKKIFSSIFRPLGLMASTAVVAAVILFLIMSPRESDYSPYRFVIYRPNVNQVEIAGSFNNWKAMPLRKIASSGYWDVVINLSRGEHKFVYILEGNKRVPDPTIITRENDDFGGENSILLMEI